MLSATWATKALPHKRLGAGLPRSVRLPATSLVEAEATRLRGVSRYGEARARMSSNDTSGESLRHRSESICNSTVGFSNGGAIEEEIPPQRLDH